MDLSTCCNFNRGGGGAIKFSDRHRHNRRRRRVLRDNITGVTKSATRSLARNGGVKRIVYPFQDIDDPSTCRFAILQRDKVRRLSTTREGVIYDLLFSKTEYTYNKKSAQNGGWGCEGSVYGCIPCNAQAAHRFLVPPTQAELDVNPGAQPVLRNICAYCCFQLMGGIGANHEIAPVSCIVLLGEEKLVKVMHSNGEDSALVRVLGGCPNILNEMIYSGKYVPTNHADKMGDVEAYSNVIKVVDEQKINNSHSSGENGRLSGHNTTAWYDDPCMPGQEGRTETWQRTREMLTDASPSFGRVLNEIETCNGLGEGGIYDGHMDHSKVEKTSTSVRVEPGKFDEHTDKCAKDKHIKRGILTGGRPIGKPDQMKIMRISDRKYGRWVDIVVDHGSLNEMDLILSGAISGRFTHSIRDAAGSYATIMDYGTV